MTAVLTAAQQNARARSAIAGRAQALALAAVGWGAFAFGGAYPWAYWPLATMMFVAGGLGIATRAGTVTLTDRRLVAAFALPVAAIAIQLIPLPLAWLRLVSPNVVGILEKVDFAYGAGLTRFHSLSIDWSATLVSLVLFAALIVLMIGLARTMAFRPPRTLVEVLTAVGVSLALIGIVQKPLYAGRLLGFWTPEATGSPFGPFVNKNHFAGWMLMALPLSLGLLCAGLERAMRDVRSGWRHKVLWLSSPEANRLILLASGALIMSLSLVLTMSRSGISALTLSIVLMGIVVFRGLHGRSRRAVGAVYLVVLLGAAIAWVGVDVLATRFANTNWNEFNDRRGAWLDALGVAAAFPLTGTGLNTYATVARFYQRHDLSSFYGEAHNDYLQVLAEGGALVAIPSVICVIALGWEILRRMRHDGPGSSWWLRRAAVTAIVAIGLQESVEFSLQMPGNAALFAVVCALALHPPRETVSDERPGGRPVERPRLRVVASNAFAGSR
jgi:O-antigen ligase